MMKRMRGVVSVGVGWCDVMGGGGRVAPRTNISLRALCSCPLDRVQN